MSELPPRRPLLGAYAMAPKDPREETEFYAGVAALDLAGLELPLTPEGAPSLTPQWRRQNLRPEWDLLMTVIPTVVRRVKDDPRYGLASVDADGRAAAVADAGRARDLALRIADERGRPAVVAMQLHSAPGGTGASSDALARSLEEVVTWDLAGAAVLIEHCDAPVPGRTAAKGYLSLADELAAVASVGSDLVGVSVNWGRSAIEGRSVATPLEHVQAAARVRVLRAVVFSGATDQETAWGPAWSDAHIPPRADGAADSPLAPSAASLLGSHEIAATLAAAGEQCLVAVKVAVRPADADVATRLAVARAALGLVGP